jgi:glutamate-1-semialdehyde 2,1-aminomutase
MLSQEEERAGAVLGGGASSPVRAGRRVGGTPFYQSRGKGALAYDQHGRPYIDYVMGYGPLLFGYRVPGTDTLRRQFDEGVLFGSTCEEEVRLAERIRGHLPSMERLRFTTTGTEAVMGAVRVARAATGRAVVVRFGGNYHGHSDFALLDAGASAETADPGRSGIPEGVASDIRVLHYNDLEQFRELCAREGDRIAAVLVEPVVGNMGLVEPLPGMLAGLIELAHAVGALVIFDEVITWLRLGLSGCQGRFGLRPDLTTIGKILGGGLPIAAFGGSAECMNFLAPNGPVFTGGTHAGNPLSVAAGHAVLNELETRPEQYEYMRTLARMLAEGLREIFARRGIDYTVNQLESIVDFKFRPGPAITNYEQAKEADAARFARYYHSMRKRGVLLAPSYNEVMFLSTEHTEEQIRETLAAADASIAEWDSV